MGDESSIFINENGDIVIDGEVTVTTTMMDESIEYRYVDNVTAASVDFPKKLSDEEISEYKKKISFLGLSVTLESPNLTDYEMFSVRSPLVDLETKLGCFMVFDTTFTLRGVHLISGETDVFMGNPFILVKNPPSIWKIDRSEVIKYMLP